MGGVSVIVCIDFKGDKSDCVLTHVEVPRAPLPRPGQKGEIYTFRVLDVPEEIETKTVGELLAGLVRNLGGRPGVDYGVAFNIPWQKLSAGELASDEALLSRDEACRLLGISNSYLSEETARGLLAACTPPKRGTGMRPNCYNMSDVKYYQTVKKSRGRPRKGEGG